MVRNSITIGHLKDLNEWKTHQNAMESSSSVPQSPPQSRSKDHNSTFAVTSESSIKMASPSTSQFPSTTVSNYASILENRLFPSEVLNAMVCPPGKSFSPHFMTDIEGGYEIAENSRPRDISPCNISNKSAIILPSVPPNAEKSTMSLPDKPMGHTSPSPFPLFNNSSFALPLTSANTETATTRTFKWTTTSSADKIDIVTNLTPKLADEAIKVVPQSDLHAAPLVKTTMGLVLTCHDRLETVLTPKNIIEYQSMGNLDSPTSASNGQAWKSAESFTEQNKHPPTFSQNGSRSLTTSTSQNFVDNSSATKTIESMNERPTISCSLVTQASTKSTSKPTGNCISIVSTKDNTSLNYIDNIDSSERLDPTSNIAVKDASALKSTARPTHLDLPQPITETSTSGAKRKSEARCKSLTKSSGEKLPARNSSLALSASQNRTKTDLSVSKRSTDSPTKPKILTKSPLRDKVDKKLFRYSISSLPGTSQIEMRTSASVPMSTVVLPSKPKNITKSPTNNKMDKKLNRSTTETTSMPQNKIVEKATVPKNNMQSPTNQKTVPKSPSVSNIDKKNIEVCKTPPTKTADASLTLQLTSPAKNKVLSKTPSVEKIAAKKSIKKERSTMEPSPVTVAERQPSLKPPWRSGPWTPSRSQTGLSLAQSSFIRRSESSMSVNAGLRSRAGTIRPATSLPHIPRSSSSRPCLLVALRPTNLQQERERFFESEFTYEPQFEYEEAEISAVLEKYREGSALFIHQAVRIMETVLRKYGSYENFEEATGGNVLPKSQVWAAVRKYLQKEGCVGEVVVRLSDELLSQAVMVVENCRPTLTINLAGARQLWLEGMLRHEIGTHYLRGVNNSLQPWASPERRKALGLKGANPTEEGLASLHSVLLRKHPHLWRAALLYYTVHHAHSMSFSQLFHHIGRFVHSPDVRWEYCLRAKRGQTDTSRPGCFSKDQVYLDGILRILRHRRNIDFQLLTALGKVSFEDVERLRPLAVLSRTRIPHFMTDTDKYQAQLDHILQTNELSDEELQLLLP